MLQDNESMLYGEYTVMHNSEPGTAVLGYDIVTADTSCAVLNLSRETAVGLCVPVSLYGIVLVAAHS